MTEQVRTEEPMVEEEVRLSVSKIAGRACTCRFAALISVIGMIGAGQTRHTILCC